MFISSQGVRVTFGGHRPGPTGEPSPPWSPSHAIGASSTLRAFKGEGEIRIEAHVRAEHARGPLIQYWGEGDGFTPWRTPRRIYDIFDRLSGGGMTERGWGMTYMRGSFRGQGGFREERCRFLAGHRDGRGVGWWGVSRPPAHTSTALSTSGLTARGRAINKGGCLISPLSTARLGILDQWGGCPGMNRGRGKIRSGTRGGF